MELDAPLRELLGRGFAVGIAPERAEEVHLCAQLCEDRRKNPRDDLASALANGQAFGQPLPPFELLSYFALLIIAGKIAASIREGSCRSQPGRR